MLGDQSCFNVLTGIVQFLCHMVIRSDNETAPRMPAHAERVIPLTRNFRRPHDGHFPVFPGIGEIPYRFTISIETPCRFRSTAIVITSFKSLYRKVCFIRVEEFVALIQLSTVLPLLDWPCLNMTVEFDSAELAGEGAFRYMKSNEFEV